VGSRLALPGAVLGLAVAVWLLWDRGGVPTPTLDERAFGSSSYEPYAWWMTHRTAGWVRHYPTEVGPTCLNRPLANEDFTISTSQEDSPYA
jgi:hypothetical protein